MNSHHHSKQQCSCDQNSLHLHVEIENLKQRLLEREKHIVKMETNFLNEADKFPNGKCAALGEQILTWQDKYSRLFEAHKRIQRVNQGLEDKLLKMVDRCETEKNNLQEDVASLTNKLMEQKSTIAKLHIENERYKNDLNIAIQLLQCKPASNFVPQKLELLPPDIQAKVKLHVTNSQRKCIDNNINNCKSDMKTIKVPIPTFPPTAMVYSLGSDSEQIPNDDYDKNDPHDYPCDIVSAAIMARVLKEREKERNLQQKHCQTCLCVLKVFDNKLCQTDEIYPAIRESQEQLSKSDYNKNNNQVQICDHSDSNKTFVIRNKVDKTTAAAEDTNKVQLLKADCDSASDLIDLNEIISDANYQYINYKNSTKKNCLLSNMAVVNRDLISFDSTSSSPESIRGPRPCSVRVQPGSNNILLDNVAHYSMPVLYKRRSNAMDVPEPTVHGSKNRASSASSTSSNGDVRAPSPEDGEADL